MTWLFIAIAAFIYGHFGGLIASEVMKPMRGSYSTPAIAFVGTFVSALWPGVLLAFLLSPDDLDD